MGAIEEILAEYQQMRENGLEAKDTLRALRPFVSQLDQAEKRALAHQIMHWESDGDSEKPPPLDDNSVTENQPDVLWVRCPNCGKTNQQHEVFCYSCGQLLASSRGGVGTHTFGATKPHKPETFGSDSVLVLKSASGDQLLELRPQQSGDEFILGRVIDSISIVPDVDFNSWGAAAHGLSRLHLAIRYYSDSQSLGAADLGSVNGTYLNGQKLYPQEVRTLRDGDELRLGRLALLVHFRHPGAED